MPKRVDCIGFNDPLLILPKNERNAKIPITLRICVFPYMSVFLIILYSKHIPPYPTILLKNLFNSKIIFLYNYYIVKLKIYLFIYLYLNPRGIINYIKYIYS